MLRGAPKRHGRLLSKGSFEPTIFNPSFMKDENKQVQWRGFINKAKLGDAPESFENVAAGVKVFLQPAVASIIDQQMFRFFWAAPGPWRM